MLTEGPEILLVDALLSGDASGAIERQEARGQEALVNSDVLPVEGVLELVPAGVVVGEAVDDLFVRVTLPPGWKKEPTDDPMWSRLLDDKGRTRAEIFYKAASYDRRADMRVERRFTAGYRSEWEEAGYYKYPDTSDHFGVVRDCWKTVQRFGRVSDSHGKVSYEELNALQRQAEKWLDEHYPDWRSPSAYWDTEEAATA